MIITHHKFAMHIILQSKCSTCVGRAKAIAHKLLDNHADEGQFVAVVRRLHDIIDYVWQRIFRTLVLKTQLIIKCHQVRAHRIVEILKPSNSQELLHRHAVLEQQSNKVDTIVDERVHHSRVEGSFWPVLRQLMLVKAYPFCPPVPRRGCHCEQRLLDPRRVQA